MDSLIPRVTVIAVAVENYENLPRLTGPAADVQKLQELLVEDPDTALFSKRQFISLYNPTVSKLRQKLDRYVMDRSAMGDILLFYFSGHGIPIGSNDFGFCTVDSLWHPIEQMALPLSVLRFSDLLQTLLVGNITPVIIIDACYSGLAGRSLTISSNQIIHNMRQELQKENASSYALLCSSASHQTSQDTNDGGIFSHYLIELARNGIPNSQTKTPIVGLKDIFSELRAKVESYTGDSIPRLYLGETLPNVPLAKNTQYKPSVMRLTPQYVKIVKALWNNGEPLELSRADIDRICGKGAYGNHKKLSNELWDLVESIPNSNKRRLTERGIAFAQGSLEIPKKIIKNPETDEFEPADNSDYVNITTYNTL